MKIGWQKTLLWGTFVLYLGFLLLRRETAINQDLGRHLRLGEMILAGGEQRTCALYKNCLTYTHPDYPFINHHWGSEVIFYLIYKSGGFGGLIVLKALILGMAFLITAKHAIKNQKSETTVINIITVISVIFLSIQMMADRLTLRPEIFGYLLFCLLFWKLDKYEERLPRRGLLAMTLTTSLIILVWVNLHISFVFGLVLIWIWGISKFTSNFMRSDLPGGQPTFKVGPLAIAIISTLITLINPNGIKGALAPLNILKDYGYTVAENMTPFFMAQFKPQPEYWIYGVLLAAVLLLWGINKLGPTNFCKTKVRRVKIFEEITLMVFSIFPLMAVRHLPFFGLVIPILLTQILYGIRLPREVTGRYLPRNDSIVWIISGILIVLALINPIPLAYARLSPIGLTIDNRHELAIQFIKQNKIQGKMWNDYDIGSFLEWKLPEYKTFVDGRPEAFPVEFFENVYKPMQEKQEVWDRETEKYEVEWVFAALTDTTPWFQKWWMMIQIHPDWKIVYLDDYSAVLVKKNGINSRIEAVGRAKTMEILKTIPQ